MSGEILLAANDLFSEEPEKIVQELWHQAKKGVTLSLILYPQGWAQPGRPPDRLIFSKGSILLLERGVKKRVQFGRAVSRVAVAQLLMRHAAVFAQAIRRLEQERGLTAEEATLAWACWEHGYGRLEEASTLEQQRIQGWANDARVTLRQGMEVLSFVQEKALQAPSDVSAWILRPPDEMGLRWPSAPQEVPDRTNLWEWLAVPPEGILRALAQAAARKKRVTLILPGKPVAGLEFHADGLLRGSYDEGGSWKADNWKDNEAEVIRFLAEEKAILRRAVVRAAAFRSLVRNIGLFEAALLVALAEHGFVSLHDAPQAGIFLIQETADMHLRILEIGTLVLRCLEETQEDPSPRWDPNREDQIHLDIIEKEGRSDIPPRVQPIAPR